MQTITLNNDLQMPLAGYGVFQIPDPQECERCVAGATSPPPGENRKPLPEAPDIAIGLPDDPEGAFTKPA